MKDRLYNLMCEADLESGCVYGDCDLKFIADHLIDSGLVIALPCKVGDTVWEIHTTNDFYAVAPHKVNSIPYCTLVNKRLGETVFLTKEEAEAKLKELQGNDGI